jgi:hypothetical protein
VITYDQTSGNLAIVTDGWWKGFNYKDGAAVRFTSISGALTAPSNRPNPPVIVDTEDLPSMLTIIFIPSGTLSLLDAVAIGTPLSDLTAEFAPNFSWPIAKVPIGCRTISWPNRRTVIPPIPRRSPPSQVMGAIELGPGDQC